MDLPAVNPGISPTTKPSTQHFSICDTAEYHRKRLALVHEVSLAVKKKTATYAKTAEAPL